MVTPHPVGDVENSIEAEEEQVVCGDGLCLPRLGNHEELWHYGHRLQEDGEGPQDLDGIGVRETVKMTCKQENLFNTLLVFYLQWVEGIVFQEREPGDRHQQELHAECVVFRVVCVPEAHVDQVHGGVGQSQEHHLRAQPNAEY